MRHHTTVAVCLLLAVAGAALAADSARLKDLKKQYEELAKNQDDEASRARRLVLLDLFDVREEKGARTLLKSALDDERRVDNLVAVVHVLGGCGDAKDVGKLLTALKKEKHRAPVLALGRGLSFTPEAVRPDVTDTVLSALRKAKGDLRPALLEGLGGLAQFSALPVLLEFEPATPYEYLERNVALGRCGGSEAQAALKAALTSPERAARLGAVRGLAELGGDDALASVATALRDTDERVVRAAAAALAAAGKKEAAAGIAAALRQVQSLRSREALREALTKLLGTDFGHDADAWDAAAAGKPGKPGELPTLPMYFGVPVASDTVLLIVDTSRSVDWLGRLQRQVQGCRDLLGSLPESASFALWDVSRTHEAFAPGFSGITANREAADTWLAERLSRRAGFDLKTALETAIAELPGLDTIVIATDSHPWGATSEESSLETMETFRHLNRVHDVRLVIALVMPGGRYEASERDESEIEERIDFLRQMAEESGGAFVHVTE